MLRGFRYSERKAFAPGAGTRSQMNSTTTKLSTVGIVFFVASLGLLFALVAYWDVLGASCPVDGEVQPLYFLENIPFGIYMTFLMTITFLVEPKSLYVLYAIPAIIALIALRYEAPARIFTLVKLSPVAFWCSISGAVVAVILLRGGQINPTCQI